MFSMETFSRQRKSAKPPSASSLSSSMHVPLSFSMLMMLLLQSFISYQAGRRCYRDSALSLWRQEQEQQQVSPAQRRDLLSSNLYSKRVPDLNDEKEQRPTVEQQKSEMLVHPAMLLHENPRNVAIVSSSPDDLVKEVEKHGTVEATIVFDLSIWSGNHNQSNNTTTCFDDNEWWWPEQVKRLETFLERSDHPFFDVVVLDTPSQETVEIPALDVGFWQDYLPGDGVVVSSLMPSQYLFWDLENIVEEAEKSGFERVLSYWTRYATYRKPSYFVVSLKSFSSLALWHRNEAWINLELRRRLNAPLAYFDGATMQTIEYPSKEAASWWCWDLEDPRDAKMDGDDEDEFESVADEASSFQAESSCDSVGSNPFTRNAPRDHLQVQRSSIGENAGRGLFAAKDIPSGSYINLQDSSRPLRLHWTTTDMVSRLRYDWDKLNYHDNQSHSRPQHLPSHIILRYYDAYGYVDEDWGQAQYTVESSVLTFMNHGCNGNRNVGGGFPMPHTEVSLDPYAVPDDFYNVYKDDRMVYNPDGERNYWTATITSIAEKDIHASEELLCSYIFFARRERFANNVLELRAACNGALGYVEQLQNENKNQRHPRFNETNSA